MTSRFLSIILVASTVGFAATAENTSLGESQQKLAKKPKKAKQPAGPINLT